MKTVYKAIVLIAAVFLLLGCVGNSTNNSENTKTAPPQDTAKSTPTETQSDNTQPAKTTEPVTIASWTGESTKNTETFTVPSDEWKISWDTTEGKMGAMNFQIYVYDSTGTMKGVAANVVGTNNDSTIMRGSGDYYLMINTAQPYTITVSTV